MAKISHFVVTYNHETKEWDVDSEIVLRLGGTVFDTVSGDWEIPVGETEAHKVDIQAATILFDAVNGLEEPNG